MDRRTSRTLAGGLASARLALGVVAYVAPAVPARPWVGDASGTVPVKVLARALGARDIALGAGAILALRRDRPLRGWIEAGAMADAGDVAATLISFGSLPRFGRWAVLVAAAGGVVASHVLAPSLD